MTRTFTYRFQDGRELEHEKLTQSEMDILKSVHGECTYNGWAEFMGVGQPSRLGVIGGCNTKGDGFRSGWNPALNMHIKGPEHYSQVLKEKGLREVGNEKQRDPGPKKKSYITDEVVKEAVQMGAEISGNEAAALVDGTFKGEAGA